MRGFEYVKQKLHQRFPLIMVDRVVELGEDGNHIVTMKNVTGNEICFLGHFPQFSILPGIYVIEAMAQSASILFSSGEGLPDDALLVLGSVGGMRFLKPIFPGDRMDIRIDIVKKVPDACIVEGQVHVDDQLAAKGQLTFAKRKLDG